MRPSKRRWVFGGLVALGTALLYVGTLGLFPLDGGLLPQRDLFRSPPDAQPTGYEIALQNNVPDIHSHAPWYTALGSRPSWGHAAMQQTSEVPAVVYTRLTPLAGASRQAEIAHTYNLLRGVQLGGLALVLAGGVGLVWPRGGHRKIQMEV